MISKVWRVKALAPWNAQFRASARVDSEASTLAPSLSARVARMSAQEIDYKRRVLTTTRGGLVKDEIYHKEEWYGDDETCRMQLAKQPARRRRSRSDSSV